MVYVYIHTYMPDLDVCVHTRVYIGTYMHTYIPGLGTLVLPILLSKPGACMYVCMYVCTYVSTTMFRTIRL